MADGTIAARVVAQLRDDLYTGRIPPGAPLSQTRLADRFSASRIPVRDALQQLASEGLVDLQPSGAVAKPMSIVELQELYEMRGAIEPILTQMALSNVGRAETMRMTALYDSMSSSQTTKEWLESNADFHAAVYRCADRPRMIALVDHLRKLTDRYMYLHLTVIGNTKHLQQEHSEILQATEARDASRLRVATKKHLETSHEFILKYLLEHAVGADGKLILRSDIGSGGPAAS